VFAQLQRITFLEKHVEHRGRIYTFKQYFCLSCLWIVFLWWGVGGERFFQRNSNAAEVILGKLCSLFECMMVEKGFAIPSFWQESKMRRIIS
jgi:hypothetical protein